MGAYYFQEDRVVFFLFLLPSKSKIPGHLYMKQASKLKGGEKTDQLENAGPKE